MKKLLFFILSIVLGLSCIACSGQNNTNFVPDLKIEQIDWAVAAGTDKGNNYVLLKVTNNSDFTIQSLKIDFTEKDGISKDKKTSFYADIQTSQGFDDAWMQEFIESREKLSQPISMYARVDSKLKPGETVEKVKCYYFGGWTSKDVIYPDLFVAEKATIKYERSDAECTLYYNFKSGLYDLETVVKETTQTTEPQNTEPPTTTEPLTTEPPVTEPPTTETPITEPPITEPPITEPPTTKPPVSPPSSNSSLEQLKALVNRISGRWYLEGYSDVYLDITYEPNGSIYSAYMYITSQNFSLKDNGVSLDGSYVLNDYTIYPHIQYPEGAMCTTGKMYVLTQWDRALSEDSIRIENDYIHMGIYKFIRTQGIKNQHSEFGILGDGMEHDYETKIIEATPSTYGYTLYTCKVCGYSYEDDHHNWAEVQITNLYFNQNEYALVKGSTVTIQTTIEPINATVALTWESSDNSVAAVNNGVVTAVGNGTAIITATTPSGDNATCAISVHTPVTGISIEQSSYTIYKNSSVSIIASVVPTDASNKRLTWSSSDTSIVRVTNGRAEGVSNGTATVTARTEDGGFSAQCIVTVVDAPLSADYSLSKVSFIDGWKEGLNASVVVTGGSGNYSSYTFNISIYYEDGSVIASKNNIPGNSYNLGCIVTLEVPVIRFGTFSAVFEIIDDEGNSHLGSAKYLWPSPTTEPPVTETPETEPPTSEPPVTEPAETEPPATEPVSDVLIISDSQTISNQTIDTDIYITSTGVVTFNNVTVNGNIYCYGKLTVSGGSANNLYAYYLDLGGITSSCDAWDGTHGLIKGAFRTCGDVVIKDFALDYAFIKWGKQ